MFKITGAYHVYQALQNPPGNHSAPRIKYLPKVIQSSYPSEGFTHGFVVLSETAEFLYKTTDYYAPEYERSIVCNDLTIHIN